MKMQEAMEIMERGLREPGFLVHFDWAEGGFLKSDYFPDPDAGEQPIPLEAEAWQMAEQFAAKTRGQCVNVYVIRAENFAPVPDYQKRAIKNR